MGGCEHKEGRQRTEVIMQIRQLRRNRFLPPLPSNVGGLIAVGYNSRLRGNTYRRFATEAPGRADPLARSSEAVVSSRGCSRSERGCRAFSATLVARRRPVYPGVRRHSPFRDIGEPRSSCGFQRPERQQINPIEFRRVRPDFGSVRYKPAPVWRINCMGRGSSGLNFWATRSCEIPSANRRCEIRNAPRLKRFSNESGAKEIA